MRKPTQRQRALWALAGEPFYPGLRVKVRQAWLLPESHGTVLNMTTKRVLVQVGEMSSFWFLREEVTPTGSEEP